VNADVQHAREMVELIRGLRAKVNLIALNSGPEIPFTTPTDDRVLAFQSVLTQAGIPAFIRRPRGRDIFAACGQLKRTVEIATAPAFIRRPRGRDIYAACGQLKHTTELVQLGR
jgi:23S rRNA (adenine2503-C2)-methyltransferase